MFKFMPWLLFKLFLSFYQTVSQKIFRCFKINQEKTLNGYKLLHWEEEKKKKGTKYSVFPNQYLKKLPNLQTISLVFHLVSKVNGI